MLKKCSKMGLLIILLLCLLCTVSNASQNTKLEIIQNSSEIKYLENDQGFISKQIVDSDSEKGEVTIELKVSNTKKEETKERYENTEVFILVDENLANNEENLQKYLADIETFCTKIYQSNSNTKIGIIGIKGTIRDYSYDANNLIIIGENDEGDVDGTAANAEIITSLTKNINDIKNNIQNMNSSKIEYRLNLQAAIRLAKNSYSNNANKILISLYDGVPSISIGTCHTVSYGGSFNEYQTAEEAIIAQHEDLAQNTKSEIMSLNQNSIDFILLRPDDTSYDETWYNPSTGEKTLDFDGSPYVQTIYGTIDNPTYGKMYSFDDSNIDTIITENIFQDVKSIVQSDIKSLKIEDFFSNEIIDNFDFSLVGTPNFGTVSETIDKTNKSITWNIDTLKGNEVATLKYKLKIKNMNNTLLLDKALATNEKVEISYNDYLNESKSSTLTSSPIIKLVEIKDTSINNDENNNNNTPKDSTVANKDLSNAGKNHIIITIAGITLLATIIFIIKYKKLKNIIK